MNAEANSPILGIAHVAFQVSDLERSRAHYAAMFGLEFAFSVEEAREAWYLKISDDQFLKLVSAPEGTDDDRLVELALQVSDVDAMVGFLVERGLKPSTVVERADGTLASSLLDPDGHRLWFVDYVEGSQQARGRGRHLGARRVADRMWHVGLLVADEVRANAFYREVLGFREDWRASRYDGGPDAWVSLDMPGGRGDSIEYILLNGMKPSREQLGSMHHLCLLSDDINETHRRMLALGAPPLERYEPMVGRSNRWLFNVFDPDGTRTELMERDEVGAG